MFSHIPNTHTHSPTKYIKLTFLLDPVKGNKGNSKKNIGITENKNKREKKRNERKKEWKKEN